MFATDWPVKDHQWQSPPPDGNNRMISEGRVGIRERIYISVCCALRFLLCLTVASVSKLSAANILLLLLVTQVSAEVCKCTGLHTQEWAHWIVSIAINQCNSGLLRYSLYSIKFTLSSTQFGVLKFIYTHTHICNEMSTFKINKIIDKPSLGHFSFASPRSPSYGVTACFARLLLFSIMLFGIDGCNLILYMLIKITFRKGAVVGLLLKLCLLATEEKDDEEGTPGKAQCWRVCSVLTWDATARWAEGARKVTIWEVVCF